MIKGKKFQGQNQGMTVPEQVSIFQVWLSISLLQDYLSRSLFLDWLSNWSLFLVWLSKIVISVDYSENLLLDKKTGLLSIEEKNHDNLCVLIYFSFYLFIIPLQHNSVFRLWTCSDSETSFRSENIIIIHNSTPIPSCVFLSPSEPRCWPSP